MGLRAEELHVGDLYERHGAARARQREWRSIEFADGAAPKLEHGEVQRHGDGRRHEWRPTVLLRIQRFAERLEDDQWQQAG